MITSFKVGDKVRLKKSLNLTTLWSHDRLRVSKLLGKVVTISDIFSDICGDSLFYIEEVEGVVFYSDDFENNTIPINIGEREIGI
jgi:hypothetical protein